MTDFTAELDAAISALQAETSRLGLALSSVEAKVEEDSSIREHLDAEILVLTEKISNLESVFKVVSETATKAKDSVNLLSVAMEAFHLKTNTRLFLLETPRKSLIAGTYDVSPETVGHTGTLTTIPGNISTVMDNQVFENVLIDGWLNIKHNGVKLINCHVKARKPEATETDFAAVKCYRALTVPAEIIDCTIESFPTNLSTCGVKGRDMVIKRCNIFGSIDGIMAINSNVKVLGNWVHDLFWSANGHKDGGPTHNDCLQIEGGDRHEVIGNLFQNGYKNNAAIMVTQNAARITGLIIESNKFVSTETETALQTPVAINIAQMGKGIMTGVRIAKNVFSNQNAWRNARAGVIDGQTYDDLIAKNNLVENTYLDKTAARITRNNTAA